MALGSPEDRNDGALIHQQGESVSSIGPKWPPVRASFERIKGIYTPGPLCTIQQFQNDFFPGFAEYLNSPLFGDISNDGYTRISLRAVVSNDLLVHLPDQYRNFVEAAIPLSGTKPVFENHSLVYFGANHESRISDGHRLEQNWENHNMAIRKDQRHPDEIMRKPHDNGYGLEVIENTGSPASVLVDEVHRLIRRFGYSIEDTKKILADPTFTLGVAVRDGSIVAVGLAEMNEVEIGGETLSLVELTEASTDMGHLHKGLYSGIATKLLQYVAERSQGRGFNGREIDMVYGESNGSAPGVLITAAYQGRTFSTQASAELGYQGKGVLPLHVPILDPDEDNAGQEIKRNNNLFPSFINRQSLYQLYS